VMGSTGLVGTFLIATDISYPMLEGWIQKSMF
jgi:hypothetical protein